MEVQRIKSRPKLSRVNDGFSLLKAWDGQVEPPITNPAPENNPATNSNHSLDLTALDSIKLPSIPESPREKSKLLTTATSNLTLPPLSSTSPSLSPSSPRSPRSPRPRQEADHAGNLDGSHVPAFSALRKLTAELQQEEESQILRDSQSHPKPLTPRDKRAGSDTVAQGDDPRAKSDENERSEKGALVPLSAVMVAHELSPRGRPGHLSPRVNLNRSNSDEKQSPRLPPQPRPLSPRLLSPSAIEEHAREEEHSPRQSDVRGSGDEMKTSSPRDDQRHNNSNSPDDREKSRHYGHARRASSNRPSEKEERKRRHNKEDEKGDTTKEKGSPRKSGNKESKVRKSEMKLNCSQSDCEEAEESSSKSENEEKKDDERDEKEKEQERILSAIERETLLARERQMESDHKEREMFAAEQKIKASLEEFEKKRRLGEQMEFEEKKKRIEEEKLRKQEKAERKKLASLERLKEMERRGQELQGKVAEEEKREKEEKERKEREEKAKRERKEQKRKEKEEREQAERLEKERLRLDREAEAERLRAEKEKAREEREAQERQEKERQRIERELEAERARAEKERWKEERFAAGQADKERMEKEKFERKRAKEEKAEKERLERLEREEQERRLREEHVDFEQSQIASCIARGQCTYAATGSIATPQYGYVCSTCSMKLCEVCVETCHNERRHLTMIMGKAIKKNKLVCECAASGKCLAFIPHAQPQHEPSPLPPDDGSDALNLSDPLSQSSPQSPIPSGAFMSSPRTHQKSLPTPQRAKTLVREGSKGPIEVALDKPVLERVETKHDKPLPVPLPHSHSSITNASTATSTNDFDGRSTEGTLSPHGEMEAMPSPLQSQSDQALLHSATTTASSTNTPDQTPSSPRSLKTLPSPVPLLKTKIEPLQHQFSPDQSKPEYAKPLDPTKSGAISARALPTAPLKRQPTAGQSSAPNLTNSNANSIASSGAEVSQSSNPVETPQTQSAPETNEKAVIEEPRSPPFDEDVKISPEMTQPANPTTIPQSAILPIVGTPVTASPSKQKPLPPPKKSFSTSASTSSAGQG